jgi:hypothetical protein
LNFINDIFFLCFIVLKREKCREILGKAREHF